MRWQRSPFGTTRDGRPVEAFRIDSGVLSVTLIGYGATVASLAVPDRDGRRANVVLGFDDLAAYEQKSPYFGATIGRCANRIAGGRFTLHGQAYQLAVNNGPNHLHGGLRGFDKVAWEAEVKDGDPPAVEFRYTSPDGDEGYPGRLDVRATYCLAGPAELRLAWRAVADRDTPVNLTNHTYFNLHGAGRGTILDHELQVAASRYTPVDATAIPTGAVDPVAGTPFDFTAPRPIGERIADVSGGYDHNFALDATPGPAGMPGFAARLRDPSSGRVLEIATTQPGLQFYSGNFLDGSLTGPDGPFVRHGALCLETQHFPDTVHHPQFPPVILRAGSEYLETATWRFSAD